MKAKKILFITQEINPYVPESQMSDIGRKLPQTIQEKGFEIRTFMPRWGNINERRNQLHEVIRLSGMNIIIDETDHPLIIKVASIQAARMQVYFIDNDDYFHKRTMLTDEEGTEYADNAERAIFYARGVLETVKKLRWSPDIIHCHGWMSSVVPLYLKTVYKDEPAFNNAKVVFSAYDEMPTLSPPENFTDCLNFRDANTEVFDKTNIDFSSPNSLGQLAVHFADGFVQVGQPTTLGDYAKECDIPLWQPTADEIDADQYAAFYQTVYGDNEE
ncbi:glycogen synthase [Alloprevotella sp. OH1205_COT-284]|uniref:glycogen/starch synthase n=1 Tax=Alloprevotella sp. OH1205_COT-284 TaxID=2491043 RepID=UPI000F5F3542|nr:glycogen/starch synthase [Alloprevotella sp. OH1205_COT-284]RRD76628.1 glycogen synthase [Alloprevotella sp. OH1205_COT-284]